MKQLGCLLVCLLLLAGCAMPASRPPELSSNASKREPAVPKPQPGESSGQNEPPPLVDVQPDAAVPLAGVTPLADASTIMSSEITREMAANFTYALNHSPDGLLPLQNGRFELVQDNPPARVTSELVDPPAFGDLNADGRADAAVLLRTNTGGSGSFYDLVVLFNSGGAPVQGPTTYIGDRQVINDLRIEDGQIVLDYLTQSPQDGLCCPSQHVLRSYALDGERLVLTREQLLASPEQSATLLPVQITIDQPAWGQAVTSPIQVSGRISSIPAQGVVEYYLTEYDNTLLNSGQIPVQEYPDGPGTFSAAVDFDVSATRFSILRLEIVHAENGLLYGRSVVEIYLP